MFKQNKNQNSQKLETCYTTKNTFKLLWKCIRFFFLNISLCKLTSIQQQVGLQRFLRLFLTDIVVRLPLHSSIIQHCFGGDGCMRVCFHWSEMETRKKNRLDYRKKEEKIADVTNKNTKKIAKSIIQAKKHWEKTEGASIIIECRLCIIFVIPIRRECNTCTYILRIVISHWGQTLVPCWSVRES